MKNLPIKTTEYISYLKSFGEWLKTLGYSATTVYNLPSVLREYFHFLESKNITTIEAISKQDAEAYIDYIKSRKNTRLGGALSVSHINRNIDVLKHFSCYIKQTKQLEIPISLQRLKSEYKTNHVILSIAEINALYDATKESPMGMRDRAMLAVYYGCGLRKSEGVNLELNDVLFDRKLLYIRKAKNNYERYVPITTGGLKHLEQYIYNGRFMLLSESSKEQALFISERGIKTSPQRLYQRIKELSEEAGISKEIGLHTLRHSIATHLLQKGMELENIALFLGHRCLDSTQIYTHIAKDIA
jgi:integrase/recombinase XerD